MALNEGDKAIIREIAFEAAKEIASEVQAQVREAMDHAVEHHADTCPIARQFEAVQNKFMGGWTMITLLCTALMSLASLAVSVWTVLGKH